MIYTLKDDFLANTNATLSFAPRLICERILSTQRTENCGNGGEVGFGAQSDDGLRNANFSFAIDMVVASAAQPLPSDWRCGFELKTPTGLWEFNRPQAVIQKRLRSEFHVDSSSK